MSTSDLRVMLSTTKKNQVKQILSSKNLKVSDFFRLVCDELIKTGNIPFDINRPNNATIAAIKRSKNKAKQLNKKYIEINADDNEDENIKNEQK